MNDATFSTFFISLFLEPLANFKIAYEFNSTYVHQFRFNHEARRCLKVHLPLPMTSHRNRATLNYVDQKASLKSYISH